MHQSLGLMTGRERRWAVMAAPVALASLLGAVLLVDPAAAHPSAAQPEAPLEAWRLSVSSKLLVSAEAQLAEVVKGVAELEERQEAKQLKQRGVLKRIGDVHVKLLSLARDANKLVALGEPAGVDYQLRVAHWRGRLYPIIEETRRLQESTIEKSRAFLDKMGGDMKRRKILDKAENLRLEGRLAEAEAVVLPPYNKMEQMGVWYQKSTDRDASLLPFDVWLNPFDTEMLRRLENDSRDALAERRAAVAPPFAQMLEEISAAADAVRRSGTGRFAGQTLAGPELVRRFGEAWIDAQQPAAECWAIEQSLEHRDELRRWRHAWQEFNQEFAAALVAIISADAERADDANAKQLYSDYCAALAPLVGLVDDRLLRTPAGNALYQFVVKSPALRSGWSSYQQVTHDLLRWRRKAAELRAKTLSKGYADLSADRSAPRQLVEPAPQVLAEAKTRLAGKPLRCADLVGRTAGQVQTDLDGNYLYRLVLEDESYSQLHATILRNDLLASKVYPLLSLEVAAAIAETERGDLVAAGGTVHDYRLRPVVSLLANASEDALGLIRIGAVPADVGSSHTPLAEVRLELVLKPDWLQQEYVCVSLHEPSGDESTRGSESHDESRGTESSSVSADAADDEAGP